LQIKVWKLYKEDLIQSTLITHQTAKEGTPIYWRTMEDSVLNLKERLLKVLFFMKSNSTLLLVLCIIYDNLLESKQLLLSTSVMGVEETPILSSTVEACMLLCNMGWSISLQTLFVNGTQLSLSGERRNLHLGKKICKSIKQSSNLSISPIWNRLLNYRGKWTKDCPRLKQEWGHPLQEALKGLFSKA